MKNRNLLLPLLICFISISTIAAQTNVEINGTISNATAHTVYLQTFENDKKKLLDSTNVKKNGAFSFKINVTKKNFYALSLSGTNDKDIALLILDNKKENSKITFNSNVENFSTIYNVEGSRECDIIESYVKIITNYQQIRNIETEKFQAAKDQLIKKTSQKKIDSIDQNFKKIRNEFIAKNQYSLAIIITASSLNPQQDLAQYQKIRDGLLKSAPESDYQIAFSKQVTQIENQLAEQKKQEQEKEALKNLTAIGSLAPELNFNNPEGKLITLKSLRGNYVLIDFWASWCKPCRMENPNVVKLYNQYKEKGFTVYSVSLDNSVERWKAAIKQDGLSWENHVSDLKQWRTEATKIYGFRGIPYTVLLDKEGKIIAKNLRGQALEKKLAEIFEN